MEKILSWLENFKSDFSAGLAKISSAQADLVTVRAELATATAALTERDGKISELTGALEKSQSEVNSKGAEVKALTEQLDTEKNATRDALAKQGLDRESLPKGEHSGAKTKEQQVDALRKKLNSSTDSKEKFTLSEQIKELLSKKN